MRRVALLLCLTAILLSPGSIIARGLSEEDLKGIGYDQHIGQQVSSGLEFRDSDGRKLTLGEIRNKKPTLLVLGYYGCPMLCTLINDGLIEALQELRIDVGRDFNIVNVSIDPRETSEIARTKKKEYLRRYGRPNAENAWYFLTGDEAAIAELTTEAGFRFRYDSESRQYAHPSGFLVLTPNGRISRYFFGVNFEPKELRLALLAAGREERGSIIHELVLLCCQYNPVTGKYGALILNVIRVGGIATVSLLAWWIVRMCRTPHEVTSKVA